MGDAAVVKGLVLIQLLLNILVGVNRSSISHGQHLARGGVQHHCLSVLRLGVSLGLFQLLLHVGLQVQVKGQGDVLAVGRRHLITQRAGNYLTAGGDILGGAAVNAGQRAVSRGLEAELSLAVHRDLADDVFGDCPVRVLADLLLIRG